MGPFPADPVTTASRVKRGASGGDVVVRWKRAWNVLEDGNH